MSPNRKWLTRVARVFDTRPRIGTNKKSIWLERKEADRRFRNALERIGAHVCMDGPTGAGKTSLSLTHLVDANLRHVAIQLTAEMTWEDFCRQIAAPTSNEESSLLSELEFGVDKWLPVAKFRISLGEKNRISIFLITLSGLILEVGLTRIYSASIWYHFAFVAISVALLGWGLGGFTVHLWKQTRTRGAKGKRAKGGGDFGFGLRIAEWS